MTKIKLGDYNPKPAKKMTRQQVIYQLARYMHQDTYKKAIEMPTDKLQQLLEWYRGDYSTK